MSGVLSKCARLGQNTTPRDGVRDVPWERTQITILLEEDLLTENAVDVSLM